MCFNKIQIWILCAILLIILTILYKRKKIESFTTDSNTPTDCVLSSWSDDSLCFPDGENNQYFRARTRYIIKPPSKGGQECGALEERESCTGKEEQEDRYKDMEVPRWCRYVNQDDFCGNTLAYLKVCKSLLPPYDDTQGMKDVQTCIGKGISKNEYVKSQKYFKKKYLSIPDYPKTDKIDCVLSDWSNYSNCTLSGKYNEYVRTRTRSIVTPSQNGGKECDGPLEERIPCTSQEYTDEFGKNMGVPFECLNFSSTDFCTYPRPYLERCKSYSPPFSDVQGMKDVQDCSLKIIGEGISERAYTDAQNYFKDKNLSIPDYPNIDCGTPINFCQRSGSLLQYCKNHPDAHKANPDLLAPDSELYNEVKNCAMNKLTLPDEYEKAQTYFKQRGKILPDLPSPQDWDLNRCNSEERTLSTTPSYYLKQCLWYKEKKEIPDYLDTYKRKLLKNAKMISEDEWEKCQDIYNKLGSSLMDYDTATKCPDLINTNFCNNPVDNIKCNPNTDTPDSEWLEQTKQCGLKYPRETSADEYKRAQDYFKTKNLVLPDMPEKDCRDCQNYSFACGNMDYCFSCISNSSREIDKQQRLTSMYNVCRDNFTDLAKSQWKDLSIKYPQYFKSGGEDDLVKCDYNLTADFCKNPTSQFKYCNIDNSVNSIKEKVEHCLAYNTIPDNEYSKVQDYVASLGGELPDKPQIDCLKCNTPGQFFCDNLYECTNCKKMKQFGGDGTNPPEDLLKFASSECLILNPEKTKQEWSRLSLKYPQYFTPDAEDDLIACGNRTAGNPYDPTFCSNPVSSLKYCKWSDRPEKTLNDDFNDVLKCRSKKLTSDAEIKRAQDYFSSKGLTLADNNQIIYTNVYGCDPNVDYSQFDKTSYLINAVNKCSSFSSNVDYGLMAKDIFDHRQKIPYNDYIKIQRIFRTFGVWLPNKNSDPVILNNWTWVFDKSKCPSCQ